MKVLKRALAVLSTMMMIICSSCMQQEVKWSTKRGNTLLLPIKEQRFAISGTAGKSMIKVDGEMLFAVMPGKDGPKLNLASVKLVGAGVKTREGASGNLSIMLSEKNAVTDYDPKERRITSDFSVVVHYPLIDKLKGYRQPTRAEKEVDDFRSYTEEFSGKLVCYLKEPLKPVKASRKRAIPDGAKLELELKLEKEVIGAIRAMEAKFQIEYIVLGVLYITQELNIQPVFIRYTPGEPCCCGGTTATTGGSYVTLRDKAIELWNRCCIRLNFLSPVYVNDDDYRVLSASEAGSLRSEYDDAKAIEVFFVEVSDPVGIWGGGACWSGGTANSQIITFDTVLPINPYVLAHELGHVFGLGHPPGNSTSGSLMEPSGFCLPNPALMSDLNCDNADNPLLKTTFPYDLCWRDTNMP